MPARQRRPGEGPAGCAPLRRAAALASTPTARAVGARRSASTRSDPRPAIGSTMVAPCSDGPAQRASAWHTCGWRPGCSSRPSVESGRCSSATVTMRPSSLSSACTCSADVDFRSILAANLTASAAPRPPESSIDGMCAKRRPDRLALTLSEVGFGVPPPMAAHASRHAGQPLAPLTIDFSAAMSVASSSANRPMTAYARSGSASVDSSGREVYGTEHKTRAEPSVRTAFADIALLRSSAAAWRAGTACVVSRSSTEEAAGAAGAVALGAAISLDEIASQRAQTTRGVAV